MAFQIKKSDNTYFIQGQLSSNQIFQVLSYFKAVMTSSKKLHICLSELIDLDFGTMRLFEELLVEASRKNVVIEISRESVMLLSNTISKQPRQFLGYAA